MRNLILGGLMAATFLSPAALSAAEIRVDAMDRPLAVTTGLSDASADAAAQQQDRRGDRGERNRGNRGNGEARGNRDNRRSEARQDRRQQAQREARQDYRQDRRQQVRQDYRQDRREQYQREARRDYRQDRREQYQREARRDYRQDRRQQYQREVRRDYRQDRRADLRQQRYDNRRFVYNGRSYNSWNNNWRNDNRYNWRSYRNNNRGLFNTRYYSPYRNRSYNRLAIGVTLGSLFYGNRYWINDPYQYRLPAVYGPYRWVRYFDDAVLVDTRNGRTVDIVYDFFF